MTETQTLWFVLAVIYAVESLRWLRAGSVGVRTWLGTGWRLVHPSKLFGNHCGGMTFLHPLPPLGTLLVAAPAPLALSPEGIAGPGTEIIPWENARKIEVRNKRLNLAGRILADAGSNVRAAQLRSDLDTLAACPPQSRLEAIRSWQRRRFDTHALRAQWEKLRDETGALRWLCNGLFLFLFALAPGLISARGLRDTWWLLLTGIFTFTTAIAVVFRQLHQRLYPTADEERLTVFLTSLLSPASAIRAVDRLSLPLVAGFHPLVVVRAFCSTDEFRGFAAVVLRQLFHPTVAEKTSGPADGFERREELNAIQEFLKQEGLLPEELLRAPPQAETSCPAYCPRCLAQFTTTGGCCGDCGVDLVPFPRVD